MFVCLAMLRPGAGREVGDGIQEEDVRPILLLGCLRNCRQPGALGLPQLRWLLLLLLAPPPLHGVEWAGLGGARWTPALRLRLLLGMLCILLGLALLRLLRLPWPLLQAAQLHCVAAAGLSGALWQPPHQLQIVWVQDVPAGQQ